MRWTVRFSSKAHKQKEKLQRREQDILLALVADLAERGPHQPAWPNYSKLGGSLFHCHLRHKWVACWKLVDKEIRILEVYYVGSREDAPY